MPPAEWDGCASAEPAPPCAWRGLQGGRFVCQCWGGIGMGQQWGKRGFQFSGRRRLQLIPLSWLHRNGWNERWCYGMEALALPLNLRDASNCASHWKFSCRSRGAGFVFSCTSMLGNYGIINRISQWFGTGGIFKPI